MLYDFIRILENLPEVQHFVFHFDGTLLEDFAVPQRNPILWTEAVDVLASEILESTRARFRSSPMASENEGPGCGREQRRQSSSSRDLLFLVEKVEERGNMDGGDMSLQRRQRRKRR